MLTVFLGAAVASGFCAGPPARSAGKPQFAKLRADLLAREESDQAVREKITAFAFEHGLFDQVTALASPLAMLKFSALGAEGEKADRANTDFMKQVLREHRWVTAEMVGEDAARLAWVMIQHADHDRAFQKDCLARAEEWRGRDPAARKAVAYLTDRLAVAGNRRQVYGTQLDTSGGAGHIKPAPIEDEAGVDARRKETGLPPMREYLAVAEAEVAALRTKYRTPTPDKTAAGGVMK